MTVLGQSRILGDEVLFCGGYGRLLLDRFGVGAALLGIRRWFGVAFTLAPEELGLGRNNRSQYRDTLTGLFCL